MAKQDQTALKTENKQNLTHWRLATFRDFWEKNKRMWLCARIFPVRWPLPIRYSYFEIGQKPVVVSCLTNAIAPPPIALESCSRAPPDRLVI